MRCQNNSLLAMVCALLLTISGCAATSATAQASISRSHLDQQDAQLAGALRHLNEAWRRLLAQADPHLARPELFAGLENVRQAANTSRQIRTDVSGLSKTAASLQHQIDDHRNDWLGPRARRLRNRIVILIVLFSIGVALLRLGPLLGGPFGGGAIIAGHLLTAFALPLLRGAWSGILWGAKKFVSLWKWVVELISKIGSNAAGAVQGPAPSPVEGGITHAAA